MATPPGVDLSKAEPVEYEIEGKPGKTRIRIKEGAVLEVTTMITGVLKIGHDPNTGLPTYNIQWQNVIGVVNIDKKLRKAVLKQPGAGEGTAHTGVG